MESEKFDPRYIRDKYVVETTPFETKPGCWNYILCQIYQRDENKNKTKVGEYIRNYSSMYNTFEPFVKDGKEYALISRHYTGTAVISLPDCKVIAEEPKDGSGFCPTGFFVPFYAENDEHDPDDVEDRQQVGIEDYLCDFEYASKVIGHFGFVCGCHWGDDSSWKIQYLDLSQIEKGIIKRDSRFGYIELMGSSDSLKDNVKVMLFDPPEPITDESIPRVSIKIAETKEYSWQGEISKWSKKGDFDSHVKVLAKDTIHVTQNPWFKEKGGLEQLAWLEERIRNSFLELVNTPLEEKGLEIRKIQTEEEEE